MSLNFPQLHSYKREIVHIVSYPVTVPIILRLLSSSSSTGSSITISLIHLDILLMFKFSWKWHLESIIISFQTLTETWQKRFKTKFKIIKLEVLEKCHSLSQCLYQIICGSHSIKMRGGYFADGRSCILLHSFFHSKKCVIHKWWATTKIWCWT